MTLIDLLSTLEHKDLAASKDTPSDDLAVIRRALVSGYIVEVEVMVYRINEKGLNYLLDLKNPLPAQNPIVYTSNTYAHKIKSFMVLFFKNEYAKGIIISIVAAAIIWLITKFLL